MQLNEILDNVVNLPPTPQILAKLQRLLKDEDTGIHEIISLLKVDAPMTAQIVRLSNSAYYCSGDPVHSLEDAVNRLGFREVYRVTSLAAANQLLGAAMPLYRYQKGEMLENSVACAIAMVEIAARTRRRDLDAAYTTGLLSSIGKVVINQYFMKHGIEVYASSDPDAFDVSQEQSLFGFDHADAGAALLNRWSFSSEITVPVQYQLRPTQGPEHVSWTCQLAIARAAAPALCGRASPSDVDSLEPAIFEWAGISREELEGALQDARTGLEEMNGVLAAV